MPEDPDAACIAVAPMEWRRVRRDRQPLNFTEVGPSRKAARVHYERRTILITVSGVPRGEQRRRYDDYRRTLLPKHGYGLVIFDYAEFDHTSGGRLVRNSRDREIVTAKLRAFLSGADT